MPILTKETPFDLVHIGKCGGGSVTSSLHAANFQFTKFHLQRPVASPHKAYLILARDPVARFVSAFNWRKHLYSTGVLPRDNTKEPLSKLRHQAEREFLFLFENANALAEQLGAGCSSDVSPACSLLALIGHVPQGFDWYLGHLIEQIEPRQIVGIICTENLSSDFKHLFGFPLSHDQHRLNHTLGVQISEKGRANLVKECYKEYAVLHKLSLMAQSTGVRMSMRYDPALGALPNLQSSGHIFESQNQLPSVIPADLFHKITMKREAIEALVLEIVRSKAPRFEGKIQPDTPLGAGGLAIDSIGTLEIVLEVERRSGIRLRDESLSADALASPGSLVDHLVSLREDPNG